MNAFGPFYPPVLQDVVNHAERLGEVLAKLGSSSPNVDERTAAWLDGRAEEVAVFVADLTNDWRYKNVDEATAVQDLRAYLALVHDGLRSCFGESYEPRCCTRALEMTPDTVSPLSITWPRSLHESGSNESMTAGDLR